MKVVTIAIAVAGLLLGTVIVGSFGFAAVGRGLAAVGWTGFVVIVACHLVMIGLLGLCWYLLVPRTAPLATFVWGRLIRDSGSEVLPLSQVGGYVMGARAVNLWGVPGAVAAASTIVDITLEVFGQLGYTLLGLGVLAAIRPGNRFGAWSAFGVVVGLVAVSGFVAVQRRGLAGIERQLGRLAARWINAVRVGALRQALDAIYRHPAALVVSGLLHFAVWVASCIEAWLAFRFMGHRLGWEPVIVMESLLYAIRSVAFAVPNAVGVQEGAYVMLAALFGLPASSVLALSLLKRARDLVIGVPALLAWQLLEGRRLLSQPAASDDSAA